MFELSVKFTLSSAHFLREYAGKCKELHGHNWKVTVYAGGEKLTPGGMLIDFGDLKGLMKTIEAGLDHKCLNDVPFFAENNPTAENIARYIYSEAGRLLSENGHKNCKIIKVSVFETENCEAVYYE